jgi:diguanylate cyclase (GGDEF)-like protein
VQRRRTGVFLAGMLALLAGTAAYVVVHDRVEIWREAHENALNVALGLESASSALFEQSLDSLRGVEDDLTHAEARRQPVAVLHNAMRFDPVSAYLGIAGADGSFVAVGRDGAPVPEQVAESLRHAIQRPPTPGVALLQLIQIPGTSDWFMPVTLAADASAEAGSFEFCLIPARRMAAGADSLRLLPDSYVTFAAADGRRLLRYRRGQDMLEVNGPPLPPERLAVMGVQGHGSFEMDNSINGRPQIAGYSRSSVLPLYVATVVPMDGLYRQWARESTGPVLVLLIGILGVVVFGVRLRASLLRQAGYLAKERYRADHDLLTGLLNRDAFMRRVDAQIAASVDDPFTVVLLDINNFKDINDTLGHAAGDEVLKAAGRRMSSLLGDEDVQVARLGGDELGIFARRAHTAEGLEALRLRLQECLGEPIVLHGVELELAANMGAAVYPEDAHTASELMRCADIAMYAGKAELKPFSRYAEMMDQFAPEVLALKAEFAKAIRERALGVVYQPKVRLADGALVGVEALSRWVHPTRGPIPPSRFVPLAENAELIHPFTRLVLETALAQAAAWQAAGHAVPVAVNISANNLLDHTFIEHVRETLERLALPPALLELEVTESAVMRHPESIVKRMQALRELGVRLAIDDFGTGYASLSYLKRLPVHTLKIDMSFVANLEHDLADQRIVKSAIQLGHGFGVTVVAEGVESARVAAMLVEYGCDAAQGYHFARPLPAEEIDANWLARPAGAHAGDVAPAIGAA